MPSTTPSSTAHLSADLPLEPAVLAWEIYLQDQGRSPHTIKAFAADIRLLAGFLAPGAPIGRITTTELNQFLEWIQNGRGVPCSPKTLARRITSLKSFFRWLFEYGVIAANPAERVVQRSVISPLPEVLNNDEIDLLLQAAEKYRTGEKPDHRYALLFQLLLATGIKKGECLSIAPNHIVTDAPEGPYLFVRYQSPANRHKERKITLPSEWIDLYNQYVLVNPVTTQVFPWSMRRLEYLLEDLSKAAGIEKHVSFDMCRWTSALIDWRSGMEPNLIRQKLGISPIQWREIKMKLQRLNEQD